MAMDKGFTQYRANQVVGRQTPRPVRGPGRPATNDGGTQNYLNPTAPNYVGPVVAPAPVGTRFSNVPSTTTDTDVPPILGGRGSYLNNPDAVANLNAAWAAVAPGMSRPGVDPNDIAGDDEWGGNPITWSTGGGGGGETTAQRLAREAAERGAQSSAGYLEQLLAGAGAQYAPLLAQIAGNQASLEGTVKTNYDTALAALLARVGTANTETTTNYDALRDRLTAAAPRAYANLPAAQAPALSQDAVSAYAQAIGAPTQAIGEAAVQAAAPYAGTADAYNRLIENLKANEAAGQASRLAGVDMGRTSTASRIGAQQLSSTNALDVQKNAALAQILQSIQGQQLGISQSQLAYEQGLRQALAGIYGTGYARPTPRNADGSVDYSQVDWEALGRLMRGK
mgnify:CR=1 FL=1